MSVRFLSTRNSWAQAKGYLFSLLLSKVIPIVYCASSKMNVEASSFDHDRVRINGAYFFFFPASLSQFFNAAVKSRATLYLPEIDNQ